MRTVYNKYEIPKGCIRNTEFPEHRKLLYNRAKRNEIPAVLYKRHPESKRGSVYILRSAAEAVIKEVSAKKFFKKQAEIEKNKSEPVNAKPVNAELPLNSEPAKLDKISCLIKKVDDLSDKINKLIKLWE